MSSYAGSAGAGRFEDGRGTRLRKVVGVQISAGGEQEAGDRGGGGRGM